MAVDPKLAAAFIDCGAGDYAPQRLLGVRVRRLCLWHRLLLNTLESPFMCQGRVTFRDLRIAVGVCRLGFGDSVVRKPWLVPAIIWVWALICNGLTRGKPGRDGMGSFQRMLSVQCGHFLKYTSDYLQAPLYAVIPPTVSPSASAAQIRGSTADELEHAATLIGWTHWPERYVWELPLGRANWYRVLAQRAAGADIDFTTLKERELQEQLPPEYRFKV